MMKYFSTYLNDRFGSLRGSQSNDIFRTVHQDALSLHRLPLKCEIFCRVDDGAIL